MNDHDQELGGDEAKFVMYSILSIKRGHEKVIPLTVPGATNKANSISEIITEDTDEGAYRQQKISDHATDIAAAMADPTTAGGTAPAAPTGQQSTKHLRVYYNVLARYKRPDKADDTEYLEGIDKSLKAIKTKYLTTP